MQFNFKLFFYVTYRAFFKTKNTQGRLTGKRFRKLVLWYILIPFSQIFSWLGFMLDEVFFPAYRQQKVESPVFIIGNFRSGSTLLHRLMAQDKQQFTSMRTWEIYLAPSITQRVIIKKVSQFDRKFLNNTLHKILEKQEQQHLDTIQFHRVVLRDVEEDEGLLLHNWSTAFFMFVYPFTEVLEPIIKYDDEVPEEQKKIAMQFYQRCLQRHVYFHQGKRYLAKNPASTSRIKTLRQYFPDAKFIYLVRNPIELLASKTNYFGYVWHYFGDPAEKFPLKDIIFSMAKHWYHYPLKTLPELPVGDYSIVKYDHLVKNLETTVSKTYQQLSFDYHPSFARVVHETSQTAKKYKSKNVYSLKEMGYRPEQIYRQLKDVFDKFEFPVQVGHKQLT